MSSSSSTASPFAVVDSFHNPCPVASGPLAMGPFSLNPNTRKTDMTRATISLPTRLQLLNFFLIVDNVVKSVIARLKEERTPDVGEGPTKEDLDEVRGVILKLLDEVISLRDDVDKQKNDAVLFATLAALNNKPNVAAPLFLPFAPSTKPGVSSTLGNVAPVSPDFAALETSLAQLNRYAAAASTSTPPTDSGE